mgnify:CR=1 FL=1
MLSQIRREGYYYITAVLIQYPKTQHYFRKWLQPSDEEADIFASEEEIARAHALIPEQNAEDYAEFKALIGCTGRYLLRYDCCLFHAVAFYWQEHAWLLTAPSGTGKTTQFMNWRKLYPAEISMISGDIPALERCGEEIMVHPSPWNGKEMIGSLISAPLGGIVILEQGTENRITQLKTRDAMECLFNQFVFRPETEDEILAMCRFVESMLNKPIWKLINKGDAASTELLRMTLSGGDNGTI